MTDHNPAEPDCPANSLDPLLQHHAESFCQCALIRAARQPLLDAVDAAISGWEYPADGPRNYSETISSALAPYRNQGGTND